MEIRHVPRAPGKLPASLSRPCLYRLCIYLFLCKSSLQSFLFMIVPKDILSPSISLSRYSLKASFQTISNVISIFCEILSHRYYCFQFLLRNNHSKDLSKMCRYMCICGENSKCGELAVLISYQPSQTHFKSAFETFFCLFYTIV